MEEEEKWITGGSLVQSTRVRRDYIAPEVEELSRNEWLTKKSQISSSQKVEKTFHWM